MNEGQFYALPQSPQTFKQLLMVSGYDRYYQIVKCFRDEDLRADRQPEFTQIDCEMSFVEQEDILQMFEGLIKYIFKEVKGLEYTEKVDRMTWEEAMWNYGNDKPDIRFGMKVVNLKIPSHIFQEKNNATLWSLQKNSSTAEDRGAYINKGLDGAFKVFDDAETVLAIAVPGAAEYTRKQLDELTEWIKRPQIGMEGMVYIKCLAGGNETVSYKSSADKFLNNDQLKCIAQYTEAQSGDLILVLAGAEERTRKAISELRLLLGNRLGLRRPEEFKLLWVVDFPLFEYSEEEVIIPAQISSPDPLMGYNYFPSIENFPSQIKIGRWVARHHPFTSPKPAHIEVMINNNPAIEKTAEYLKHPYTTIKANAYDMVLNGNEVGGGSIRIYQRDLQEKMFAALGMTKEEAQHKFGFLLGAFEYGAPPHGGIAFGFDRLCAILGGSETIRDFIAFPKNNSGRDVMLDAPSTIDEKQLEELRIKHIE
jgi:aspartyl-tRNA synthetase